MNDQEKLALARKHGLVNGKHILETCRKAEVPFYAACALFEKESRGRNVYGHDQGGALSGYPRGVNKSNYLVFRWLVFDQGWTSNGVGPGQITYKGFFTDMEQKGLKPWNVHDNMLYSLRLLRQYKDETGTWKEAGTKYNGSSSYGQDFAERVEVWRKRVNG